MYIQIFNIFSHFTTIKINEMIHVIVYKVSFRVLKGSLLYEQYNTVYYRLYSNLKFESNIYLLFVY